ncbi:hypothetical protein [Enterococcus gallinarum]|uniref:Uncharacterized protein n=1 Tax=Enterococcus gallinarum TaxID=1353 RepID=A0AAE4HVL5_ENTGA|nr:hypothetical protein [Enterococcus gallinarum]MDT2691982.1 hypothetical protein [Enterococcus gallinarum]OJG47884.1 hypothetical protein RV03_GL001590 [Enterococcus gallinarum]
MKNVDRTKNQANIGMEQKQKIDRSETDNSKTLLVLSVPFVGKIFYHPSFPSFLTPFLLMTQKLVHLFNAGYG